MTVEELISQLGTMPPYLVVQLWDTEHQRFTDKFSLMASTFDDEVLLVPAATERPREPAKSWKLLFESHGGHRACE